MSHDPATGWIDRRVRTAMQGEMDALRGVVEALAAQMAANRGEDRSEVAEAHAEIGQLRASIAELRGMFTGLLEDMRGRTEHIDAELHGLRDAIAEREAIAERNVLAQQEVIAERDARIEAVRVRLEGLMTQHRWDVEQLRESLAIVAERLPLTG